MAQNSDDILLRNLAMDIISEVVSGKEYINVITKNVLDKYNYLESNKKAFVKRLSAGVIERKYQLDYVIDSFSKTKTAKMRPVVRNILEMATYQIMFMDNVYDSAACNTAVNIAKKRGFSSLSGFINGVLRSISKGYKDVKYPDFEKEPVKHLSIMYSMPEFLVNLFIEQYGTEKTVKILESSVTTQGVTVRFDENLSVEEIKALKEAWVKENVTVEDSEYIDYACVLSGTDNLAKLPGYSEGKFVPQDLSSMLVVHLSGIEPNDRVLDVCASPGGKTMHALAELNGTGEVISCDISERKVARIEENLSRIPYQNVTCLVRDASVKDDSLVGKADVLIVDAPCSGLGVMSKKQDIKYRIDGQALEDIVKIQRNILANVSGYLAPNGTLVYSTCTVNREENEENVKWFCENFGFESLPFDNLPKGLEKFLCSDKSLQLLPGEGKFDGFYIARLRRI